MTEPAWTTTTGGFPQTQWDLAKEHAKLFLRNKARQQTSTTYSDTVRHFAHILPLEPDDAVFHAMLGQISCEEHGEGRPLLSCIVLHKDHFSIGGGFYEAAEECGYNTSDKLKFWCDEMRRTHDFWKNK